MEGHHAWVQKGSSLRDIAHYTTISLTDVDTDVLEVASLSIDDVRRLQSRAAMRPVVQPFRQFVVVTLQLPTISQNALLKLFEDPPETSKFLLVIPDIDSLLPTLRSRVQIISSQGDAQMSGPVHELLQADFSTRLTTIAEWAKAGDTAAMQEFLNSIEYYVARQEPRDGQVLAEVIAVRKQFSEPGASKKMLLEHIALLLPVVS